LSHPELVKLELLHCFYQSCEGDKGWVDRHNTIYSSHVGHTSK